MKEGNKMKKIYLSLIIVCSFVFGYDEIPLDNNQSQKLGITISKPDFSGYHLVGPFVANLDFSNQSSLKKVSPFEITISQINKFEGDSVKKGDVICHIISDSLSNLIYEYKNTESKFEIAQNNAKKDKKLYDDGVISQREYQNSYLLANELELKLKDLDSTIKQIGIDPKISGFSYPVIAQMDGILALAPTKSGQKIDAFSPYIIITKNNNMLANIKIPQQNAQDIYKEAKVYIRDENANNIEIGKIESISVAIDKMTNTLQANAILNSIRLKVGSNIDVFILSKNPQNTIAISRDMVTKFGKDNVVFIKTSSGFMPTKINIVKEINGGFLISKDKFDAQTNMASGAIIILKGAMSDLSFE